MANEMPAIAPKATEEIKRLFDDFDTKARSTEDSAPPSGDAIAQELPKKSS